MKQIQSSTVRSQILKFPKSRQLSAKALLFFGLVLSPSVFGDSLVQSVDVMGMAGGYSMTGKTSTNASISLSGFGVYKGQVEVGFYNHFRANFGMTYLLSDGFTGDSAFGFDLGLKYFPYSWNGLKTQDFGGVSYSFNEKFRPYVGLNFKTMQFSTVLSSTYTGFGGLAGSHYSLNEDFYLAGEGQYNLLAGSNQNTLTEMYFLFGLGIRLK